MKIGWGYRIAFLYISFASLIIYFVTRSMGEKIDLVSTDYYAQELKFQDKIESINRSNSLTEPLTFELNDSEIIITYPGDLKGKPIVGNIIFFRPSDNIWDKTFKIKPGSDGMQIISTNGFTKGMYRIKIEYEVEGNKYYSEKQVVVK